MNEDRIAILVDTGCDVPKELVEKYKMYVAPLSIVYKDRVYTDGVDIKAEDVYARLEEEIPSTSLPSPGTIQNIFDQIKKDGFNKVMAVTMSSGISGTYNTIELLSKQQEELEVFVLDTKNISLASGFSAIQAAEYLEQGMAWKDLIKKVSKDAENSKVFFYVSTLKYLQKGGRIGLVASILGSTLNIKPIISCNEDGVYYTVSKTRGESKALNKAADLAIDYIGDAKSYNVGVLHAAAEDKAREIESLMVSSLPNPNKQVFGQISPGLGVHTGPGVIGIVVQKL